MSRYLLPDNLGSIIDVLDRSRRRYANGGPTEAATGESTAPSPVTNLAGTTGYYRDTVQGVDLAYVDLTWDLIVPVEDTNETTGDGTDPAKAPVDHYSVRYRLGGTGDFTSSTNTKTNAARVSGLPPGNSVEFQVAAVNTTGTTSSWASITVSLSIDAGAPNAPSTPTVVGTYGGVKATWNGLDSAGAAMPSDFDHADIHASVTTGFTPSSSTKYVSVLGATTVTIPHPTSADATTPVYVKIVAYDISGNASSASAQASASPSTIVATSVADGSITETKIASGAVTTPKIFANSIDASKIAALTIVAGNIAAGAITGTKIAAGAITADIIATGTLNSTVLITAGSTANGSNRVEIDRNGVRLIRRSAGGVDTTVVDLNSNTGNGTYIGSVQSVVSGERIVMTAGAPRDLAFYSGISGEVDPGGIITDAANPSYLSLRSATFTGYTTDIGRIGIKSGSASGPSSVTLSASKVLLDDPAIAGIQGSVMGTTDYASQHYVTAGNVVQTTSAAGLLTITHGLGTTPVAVIPVSSSGGRSFDISNITSTTFDVTVYAAAGGTVNSTSVRIFFIAWG